LFLDEIGELPLHMQTKLLHVIEDKEVRPLGSDQARRVDVRIVAATNRNLLDMVKEGRFREDLYFRLSVFHIHIPPLRERKDDISRLLRFVLSGIGNGKKVMELDPMAEEILVADGDRISLADLPPDIARQAPLREVGGIDVAGSGGLREQLRRVEADIIVRVLRECGGDRRAAAQKLEIGLSSLYRKFEEFEALGVTISDT
jgi:two-component system, NtrC family, response regulator AtoC